MNYSLNSLKRGLSKGLYSGVFWGLLWGIQRVCLDYSPDNFQNNRKSHLKLLVNTAYAVALIASMRNLSQTAKIMP